MHELLGDLLEKTAVASLDDLCCFSENCFSRSAEEHAKHLREVLDSLCLLKRMRTEGTATSTGTLVAFLLPNEGLSPDQ